MRKKPILIVDDDKDDCELLTTALLSIGIENEFVWFQNPEAALTYLRTTTDDTFLIISDVNMPVMTGFDFKKKINDDIILSKRRIPFVFFSTSASSFLVNEAYGLSIQGYFQKPSDYKSMNTVARSIIEYWNTCKHPQPYS